MPKALDLLVEQAVQKYKSWRQGLCKMANENVQIGDASDVEKSKMYVQF